MKFDNNIPRGKTIADIKKQYYDAGVENTKALAKKGTLSDGYHTFNDLYYQRCVLFAVLVKKFRDKAWKSWRHEDGEPCFGSGWFIVGITTPVGEYTYHYEDRFWDMFDCEELPVGKHWDGHTDKDVTRLLSL